MLSSIRFGKSFAVRKLTPSIYHSHQRHQSRPLSAIGAATDVGIRNQQLLDFLNVKAKVSAIPTRLNLLLNLLSLRGEVLLSPDDRQGMMPFLVPLCKLKNENSTLCYIRWPTQKDSMDLQLVKTNPAGIELVSLGTDQYCKRIVAEMDFQASSEYTEAVSLLKASGLEYDRKDYDKMLRSGKFPALTESDRKLIFDKFLLTKIGAFPDCYERIATDFLSKGQDVSALVTCERAISVFYSWGHPLRFHAFMLQSLDGRNSEARDVARTVMSSPKWTIASDRQQLEEVSRLAGFTDLNLVGEMHAFRANDPRTKDIEEGVSPIQITLDQCGHLMDAAALGSIQGGWDAIKNELATKYSEGGYPLLRDFILS